MKYSLCDNPWGEEEKNAIYQVVDSGFYTMGEKVKQCEEDFAKKMGSNHAVMVNSGSSANLLAVASLLYSGKLKAGDEVIVTAVSWSTTYFPLTQMGLKLVFVDIDPHTLNMSVDAVKQAVTADTKLIVAVNLLGNSCEYSDILDICRKHKVLLLEDNCESMGATYQEKSLGTWGVLGTYSCFFSHHICTMEGGFVVTDDSILWEYMLAIRAHGWTRNLPKDSQICTRPEHPFYDTFHFIVPGFNLRPLEIEGAVGIEQLKKLDTMVKTRQENACYFQEKMGKFSHIRLQKEVGTSSWFGFAMVLQGALLGRRDEFVEKLREKGIELRPIVAGNFTKSPCISYMPHRIPFPLVNADDIHENGFFVGNHSSENKTEVDYFVSCLDEIVKDSLGDFV